MEKHYSCNGKEIKRQYLNEEERNIYMSLAAIVNMIHGIKLQRDKYVQLENVIENWDRRDFITKEEKKNLKLANTYLKKFLDAVYERLDKRTKETLEKKLVSFGFRLLDQETLKIINRYNDLKEKTDYLIYHLNKIIKKLPEFIQNLVDRLFKIIYWNELRVKEQWELKEDEEE